jgi:UPF0176 protein
MSARFTVLLYYKYARVADPRALAEAQRALCVELGLRGRILLGVEGINGTLAGDAVATARYCAELRARPEFADIVFKTSYADTPPFPRLQIKVRREIVAFGAGDDLDPAREAAPHLPPAEWKRMIEQEEVVLFDVRNRYESEVGRFRGAITPPLENFRDLPRVLPQYAHLKDKTVLMYCTGGIRCEKASALFRREGFIKVFQLEGGIVSYGEQVGDAHWEGDCFVFDERMTVPVGRAEPGRPIGRCEHSGATTRNVVNCLHDPCHKLIVVAPVALAADPDARLCRDCRRAGLTSATADYVGSPARATKVSP